MSGSVIGIDLGGTKIEGVVLAGETDEVDILARRRVRTVQSAGPEGIARQVAELVRELSAGRGELPVGVGMPGSVDGRGLVKNSNTVCLNGTDFRGELVRALGRPVSFANDADLFALAEARLGAGRGYGVVFGIIVGTGTGGGVVMNGLVPQGPNNVRGEWGHNVVFSNSERECYCGRRGCVETYLAGPWLERDFAARGGARSPRATEIFELASGGDPVAAGCVETWLDAFGRALASVINVIDPDVVVLGGGLSNAAVIYELGRARVEEHVFSDTLLTPIVKNQRGDSAGVLGAALLARGR